MNKDLVEMMAEGTMRASVLHSDGNIDDPEEAVKRMRLIMLVEWDEFTSTLKDATEANMGDAMLRQIMNTYCNAWAVKAIASK